MSSDVQGVIVVDAVCKHCGIPTKEVHHRHFPEIRAECATVAEAVAHLAHLLGGYLEGAQSSWHRETLDLAISDVEARLLSLDGDERSSDEGCLCRLESTERSPSEAAGSPAVQAEPDSVLHPVE